MCTIRCEFEDGCQGGTSQVEGVQGGKSERGFLLRAGEYYPEVRSSSSTTMCRGAYKFTGRERNPDMGVDYFGARFYQAGMARLIPLIRCFCE